MLKIFVTGDNHIGLKYQNHEMGQELAAARIQAFEHMVATANQEQCQLFVITGDLFDHTSVVKKEVKALVEILGTFRETVVVLPGNHDYYDEDAKVWGYFRELTRDRGNILLLNQYRPYPLTVGEEDVVLYPAHCTSHHSRPNTNHLDWIRREPMEPSAVYRIGIAHGSVPGETLDQEGIYFPMPRQQLEEIPVDLWLLGHTHVPFPRNLSEIWQETGKIFNPGTHVQTDVACSTPGLCFLVEVDQRKNVRARQLVTGNLRFYRKFLKLEAGTMEEQLIGELKDLEDRSVVELILRGAVTAEEYEQRHEVLQQLLGRFLEGSYEDGELSRQITRQLVEKEFAETSLSGRLLMALLEDPKEAQMAYDLLQRLKGGK